MKKIYVIKANRQKALFDSNKVIRTCMRAGASKKEAGKITRTTKRMIRDGSTTREVYKIVLSNISKLDRGRVIRHRYRLKESIMKMGPAGFPFESFIGQILLHYGYTIEIDSAKEQFFNAFCSWKNPQWSKTNDHSHWLKTKAHKPAFLSLKMIV